MRRLALAASLFFVSQAPLFFLVIRENPPMFPGQVTGGPNAPWWGPPAPVTSAP